MTTIEIDESSEQAKAIVAMLKAFDFVKFVGKKEKKSPYNAEFVKKIKEAEKRGSYTEIDPDNVWESLGLK